MLKILGGQARYCDGVSRRNFLRIGALGLGGLTLADLLRLEAAAAPGTSARPKSFINIYLGGGPSHIDTFDPKPDAPSEIRGEFQTIPTAIPGYRICELLPRIAQSLDKMVVVRALAGLNDEHDSAQSETGWSERSLSSIGGRPSVGAVVSKLYGASSGEAPTFVDFNGNSKRGFLGTIYGPYRPDGEGRQNLNRNSSLTLDRLQDRQQLLTQLDRINRTIDQSGQMTALDSFAQRALNVVASGKLASALNLDQEDPRTIDRYGARDGQGSGNDRLLLARRMIEAGVRCVSMSWGGWDTHQDNFKSLRRQLPSFDVGLSALIEDLSARGMLEDTVVHVSGEFGRTPRINSMAGRDHWAKTGFSLLAGGGMRAGQVIGVTNRLGEEPKDRPVPMQEVFATIYHLLGIDTQNTKLIDPNGRPQYLVDVRHPLPELV